MRKVVVLSLAAIIFTSCLKDRTFNIVSSETDKTITKGIILVNEICATGSTYSSEFGGTPPDWAEFYNPSADTFIMNEGKWFTTDDLSSPFKYELPLIKIPPHKFYVICCDSRDTVGVQVHTNFSLSSNGEAVGLYYKTDAGPYMEIDSHVFGPQTSGVSIGRIPDGSSNWSPCSLMTPGTPNQ